MTNTSSRSANRRSTTKARHAVRLVVALWFSACATAGSGPPTAAFRITANVPDATVWIDDRLAGRLSDFTKDGKRLALGFHRVEIRAPGYYSSFREIDVQSRADVSISADLHALLQ